MTNAVLGTYSFATACSMLLLLAVGCASTPVERDDIHSALFDEVVDDPMDEPTEHTVDSIAASAPSLIARDFAQMLPQIPELRPEIVTLSVVPDFESNADFAEALRLALLEEGYAVRIGDGGFSSTSLTYQIRASGLKDPEMSELGLQHTVWLYQVNVGNVGLRRLYGQRPSGDVKPVSAMEGRNIDPAALIVDESIFNGHENSLNPDSTIQEPPGNAVAAGQVAMPAGQAGRRAYPSEGTIAQTPVTDESLVVSGSFEEALTTTEPDGGIAPAEKPDQPVLPQMTSPVPGTRLPGADVTFIWNDNGVDVDQWYLRVGLSMGASEFAEVRLTNPETMQYRVSGLPTSGATIFVELSFRKGSVWTSRNFQYAAFDDRVSNADAVVLNEDSKAKSIQTVPQGTAANDTVSVNALQGVAESARRGLVQNEVVLGEPVDLVVAIGESANTVVSVDEDGTTGQAVSTNPAPQRAESTMISSPMPLETTANYKALNHSNYRELFLDTVVVDIQIIDFVNNSGVLSPDNIVQLQNLAENLIGTNDLISIVGTSHGGAPYPATPEDLAKGRASAIRNTLVEMGVGLERLYPEASWSDSPYDNLFPRHAAVVEVRRRVASVSGAAE